MNIPNTISIVRILLIPLFVYFFLKGDWVTAALFLAGSGLTDFLDGFIARRFNQITELGKILDPIADKLTQAAVAVCMAIHQPMLIPLLSIFIIKEALMLCGSIFLLRRGMKPGPAKWYGKIATAAFYASMFAIILLEAFAKFDYGILMLVLITISTALMVHAFIRYLLLFLRMNREAREKSPKA